MASIVQASSVRQFARLVPFSCCFGRFAKNLLSAAYIRMMRLERAAQLLWQDAGLVSEVVYRVGFKNVNQFSRLFGQVFGVPPSAYLPEKERSEPAHHSIRPNYLNISVCVEQELHVCPARPHGLRRTLACHLAQHVYVAHRPGGQSAVGTPG